MSEKILDDVEHINRTNSAAASLVEESLKENQLTDEEAIRLKLEVRDALFVRQEALLDELSVVKQEMGALLKSQIQSDDMSSFEAMAFMIQQDNMGRLLQKQGEIFSRYYKEVGVIVKEILEKYTK